MVEPRMVQRRVPLHSVIPDQSVLESSSESVSSVQASSNVGRRNGDDESPLVSVFTGVVYASAVLDELLGTLLETRLEEALGLPPVVPGSLNSQGVVSRLWQVTRNI